MKNYSRIVLSILFCIQLSACSTITKSTSIGFGTGAFVGAASGALLDKQNPSQSSLNTALIMGMIGGIAGYLTHEGLEQRDADVRKETLFNLEKYGVSGFSNGRRTNSSFSDSFTNTENK